jgi:hypothetical protein
MPKLTNKKGERAWFITRYDGPWQVFSSRSDSDGRLTSVWGVVNVSTGQMVNCGTSSPKKKINYYDRACGKALILNSEERGRHMIRALSLGYNRQDIRESIISTLEYCTTDPGALCYEGGMPAVVKRIESMNKEIRTTLALMKSKDMLDFEFLGIVGMLSVNLSKDIDLRESKGVSK